MVFLRKLSTALLALILFSQPVCTQTQEALVSAFSKSYKAEADGEYSKAAEVIKRVFNKDSYEINLRLGWLNYKAGLSEEAEGYYRRAIQIMPYGIEARFGIVFPLVQMGKTDQVILVYDELLKIDPQNSVANFRLGLVYYEQGNFAQSEKYFTKVVNLYPFDYDGLHMLAWTKLKAGKTQDAKAVFNKTLLYKPGDPSCLAGLSLIK
jgi:tetratricopeptide (TPR) repeat protein